MRDRVPAGSVAVLINRAHRFTDLICTVDQFEDPLLGAIDGTRTLGGILALLGIEESRERAARSFFERLWHYDQVVFDASGVASDNIALITAYRESSIPWSQVAHIMRGDEHRRCDGMSPCSNRPT